jgi:hypothetical protein
MNPVVYKIVTLSTEQAKDPCGFCHEELGNSKEPGLRVVAHAKPNHPKGIDGRKHPLHEKCALALFNWKRECPCCFCPLTVQRITTTKAPPSFPSVEWRIHKVNQFMNGDWIPWLAAAVGEQAIQAYQTVTDAEALSQFVGDCANGAKEGVKYSAAMAAGLITIVVASQKFAPNESEGASLCRTGDDAHAVSFMGSIILSGILIASVSEDANRGPQSNTRNTSLFVTSSLVLAVTIHLLFAANCV